ncbi:interleukin-6-like [Centropristis striata]|uniref:interleukin-6-like n=1 Tax=Centropristis striata TaxID=184440 RepID=UPI0027DF5574|nr:interleukin-6-like [Centropristis striata]
MPSQLNTLLLSAVMLAALLLCALGAPVESVPTDIPAGDPSGEAEVVSSDLLSDSPVWQSILAATKRHQEEFENEFQNAVKYEFLEHYKISSVPAMCPLSNFSKEACLHRLVQGLPVYIVLLKHVEKEYPGSLICSEVRYHSGLLITQIKQEMRNPEAVTALTSSQEVQLLRGLDNPTAFQRKMTAHSILRQLHLFLLRGRRVITKREKSRGRPAFRTGAPIAFYNQNLKGDSTQL